MVHELVVPYQQMEGALASLLAHRNGPPQAGPIPSLAIGGALLHDAALGTTWTAARLDRAAAPQGTRTATPGGNGPQGTVIVGWHDADAWSAGRGQIWSQWLGALSSTATHEGPVLLLALDRGGGAAGAVWARGHWQSVSQVRMPGPGMRRIELQERCGRKTGLEPDREPRNDRYSRLEGALGTAVLRRIQRSVFAIIGAGRTGSSVATTLVRYGASVLLIDPDLAEAHNIGDGDGLLPGVHEGLPKVAALARSLKALARPGACIDARRLAVDARVAGHLIAGADMLISAVDNDAARLWATSWAAALLLPHLDIGVSIPHHGDAGADLRLTLPGQGCLACAGGFAESTDLADAVAGAVRRDADFRAHRRGSARSMSVAAAHLGLRLVEQLYDGRLEDSRFVQFGEDARSGRLQLADTMVRGRGTCVLCARLTGMGVAGVSREVVAAIALRVQSSAQRAGA